MLESGDELLNVIEALVEDGDIPLVLLASLVITVLSLPIPPNIIALVAPLFQLGLNYI